LTPAVFQEFSLQYASAALISLTVMPVNKWFFRHSATHQCQTRGGGYGVRSVSAAFFGGEKEMFTKL
jgi:hypothetical protein